MVALRRTHRGGERESRAESWMPILRHTWPEGSQTSENQWETVVCSGARQWGGGGEQGHMPSREALCADVHVTREEEGESAR